MTDEYRRAFLAAINALVDQYNQLCLDFDIASYRVTVEYINKKPAPIPGSELVAVIDDDWYPDRD